MHMNRIKTRIAAVLTVLIILFQIPFTAGIVSAAPNPGAGEFITRLYNYALGRDPDPEGYADWCNKLLYGQVNAAEVALGILSSEEYVNRNTEDADYVNMLYHVFFNRDPDEAGMGVWTTALGQGAGRREVMMGFVNSVEWANICAYAGIYSGSASAPDVEIPVTDANRAFINNLYRYFSPNVSPSQEHIDALANDLAYLRTNCRQIAYDIIFGAAFLTSARSSSPGKVVSTFYKAFEGRDPLPAESAAMINAMNGNINLDYLYNYFVNRPAFATSCVNRGLMPGTDVVVNTGGISDESVAGYFEDAAFVGNSVTAGFPTYFSAVGRGLLGNVSVFARVSYSFLSDLNSLPGYMLQYDDVEMQVADILNVANIHKVFICMGTNDLVGTDPEVAFSRYQDYIDAIISANPGIRVFIVSTPPRVNSSQTPGLTNEGIDQLNALMQEYCSDNGMDFIDINTALKNNTDSLYPDYSSDGYVHMNNTGYGVWANEISSYVRTMLASERHIYRYRGN